MRKGLKSHLVDPWLKVESLNRRNGIVFLLFLDHIVVFLRWIKTQEHGLCTENRRVIPGGLDVDLCNIIKIIHKCTSLLNISVSQFVSNHVLLTNSKRGHISFIFGLLAAVLGEIQDMIRCG